MASIQSSHEQGGLMKKQTEANSLSTMRGYSRLALMVDSLVVKVSTFPSCSMVNRYL
jgi:hypothetical protein